MAETQALIVGVANIYPNDLTTLSQDVTVRGHSAHIYCNVSETH